LATKNRIFVSFAIEDKWAKEYLVGQARNDKVPFEFINMSVNEPFDEKWKTQCRSRVKGCDGMIALVSKNTAKADGAIWEVKTAKEEGVPVLAVYTTTENRPETLPAAYTGVKKVAWAWDYIGTFIKSL
jgi:Thoeris protein ThsB, TIR-like domain